ncbi:TetR/AcrR family transcriptional regulator [Leptospira idonii]|uniref:TetR/AcrR family transcriptional regulator n=1 Tax=Leptospira idonii TaxID=1193500 RepID=A0A4R9LZ20_9LEPT|nr:TetR family transcriptional regulator [Leptospira idonii]TGN17270.1 TetR/AcrR family transcriptional regulator [Leptospira idonii]
MSRAALMEKSPKKRAVLEKDKLSKKAGILQAAAQLLQKKDWAELSMDEVAKKAKIAKGTLYLYFPTKEDLCLRVHLIDYEIWFHDLRKYLETKETINPSDFSQWFVDSFEDHSRFLKILPIVPTILEKNASLETIREFKRSLKDQLTAILPLLSKTLKLKSEEEGFLFLMQCHALAIGAWSHGFPSPLVKEAQEEEGLEMFHINYAQFVKSSIDTLLRGMKAA